MRGDKVMIRKLIINDSYKFFYIDSKKKITYKKEIIWSLSMKLKYVVKWIIFISFFQIDPLNK